METQGVVQNGVVVFEGPIPFPEGTKVSVAACTHPIDQVERERKRVEFPIYSSDNPGSIELTNERIAEILEEEDIESVKRSWNAPS